MKAREFALQSLDLAYHKYKEISRNLEEGLKVRWAYLPCLTVCSCSDAVPRHSSTTSLPSSSRSSGTRARSGRAFGARRRGACFSPDAWYAPGAHSHDDGSCWGTGRTLTRALEKLDISEGAPATERRGTDPVAAKPVMPYSIQQHKIEAPHVEERVPSRQAPVRGGALDLPPPDSDEWETMELPSVPVKKPGKRVVRQ